jgi:hypothetical protein
MQIHLSQPQPPNPMPRTPQIPYVHFKISHLIIKQCRACRMLYPIPSQYPISNSTRFPICVRFRPVLNSVSQAERWAYNHKGRANGLLSPTHLDFDLPCCWEEKPVGSYTQSRDRWRLEEPLVGMPLANASRHGSQRTDSSCLATLCP